MTIRTFTQGDVPAIVTLWNACVEKGECIYRPLTPDYFAEKFLNAPHSDPGLLLVAEGDGKLVGFVAGCKIVQFLPGQTEENTPGYLTVVMVAEGHRRKGIGTALVQALEECFRKMGKTMCAVSSTNPVNLDWVVPGTPGHEHNNMPGCDELCQGYPFLQKLGYEPKAHAVSMYLNLASYEKSPVVEEKRQALADMGIIAGLYDVSSHCSFDGMCDRVGSEYWRSVLQQETNAVNPRPILAATCNGEIVGFTGPVDKQENGRGWFTGICTDPLYEKKGIASVLFNDLMVEFIKVGAAYSTLFTGTDNHAQRLYLRTGFKPVRHFSVMHHTFEK